MRKLILSILLLLLGLIPLSSQRFRHIKPYDPDTATTMVPLQEELTPKDTIRSIEEILASLPDIEQPAMYNQAAAPWVFLGYRHLSPRHPIQQPSISNLTLGTICGDEIILDDDSEEEVDSIFVWIEIDWDKFNKMPDWLTQSAKAREFQSDIMYRYMIYHPESIDYAFWDLPEPIRLAPDDTSLLYFIKTQDLPEPDRDMAEIMEIETKRIDWLHTLNTSIQLSQAYLSPNWYQGGTNSLTFIASFLWNVTLNQVYHPNQMLENSVSYKLALNSAPNDLYHKYLISEDLFQWNFKAGLKAFNRWFYSFTAQFKTQFLNNYAANSEIRKAAFLSPGELNLGLGMTYSYTNPKKTFKINASISPLSYNLMTCINSKVDGSQFSIPEGKKTLNEIGSGADVTIDWTIWNNISYKTRLTLFSNYSDFLGDWENTFSFTINRFLSTQIYLRFRYDNSAESPGKWKHWMLKEILSFGFAYTFSTK